MIKALFFDLDGTLLTTKKEISPKTRQTLENCKSNNIKLFIATARPPLLDKMLSWDSGTLALFDGGAYYNGGCIIVNGNKTYSHIADGIVQKLMQYAYKYDNLNIALQLEHEKHAFRYPIDVKWHNAWGVSSESMLNLSQITDLRAVKIAIFFANLVDSTTPINHELAKSLENLCRDTAQFYLTDKGILVQIMARHVNKASSIEKIRMQLGLEKNEIAVFGDDINDIEMLSEYENSIAMGNAVEIVKQKATHITLTNDNDGIHHAITNILKIPI